MYCYYKFSVAPPHGTMDWSAVCDCGISWSYSLSFYSEQDFCLRILRNLMNLSIQVAIKFFSKKAFKIENALTR